VSIGAQMVVVLKAFVERCVTLVLGHPFEFSCAMYPKQMYFIVLLLLMEPAAQVSQISLTVSSNEERHI